MADEVFKTADGGDGMRHFTLLMKEAVELSPADLQVAGDWFIQRRIEETRAGLDVYGAAFAPYSPAYAFKKGSSIVDLRSRESDMHMLDALDARTFQGAIEAGIFNNEQAATKARILNEGGQVRTRLGYGSEGFKTNPGRRHTSRLVGKRTKAGKSFASFPVREFLGATQADLDHMAALIGEARNIRLNRIK